MGVSYDAMTYVGIEVNGWQEDAEQWLIDHGVLQTGQLEEEFGGDIQYAFHIGFPLQVQCRCYLTGEDYFIGFEVSPSDYKRFDGLLAKFKEITGVEGEVLTFEQIN